MENIDLDINNYDFEELKKLFNIENEFNNTGLKRAYKMVMMTHPDKSGLDKKFFLFFSKSFKLLKSIYDYTHKKENCAKETEYIIKQEADVNIKKILKKQDTKTFNEKFNKLFEKVKMEDDEQDNGYSEWFKSDENISNVEARNVRDMNNEIETLKSEQRALIVHSGIQDLAFNSGGYNLIRDRPTEYSSDLFSKLPYEDLKKAHSETLVPVTQEDYNNRTHFKNVNELNVYRKQNEQILSKEETMQIQNNNLKNEEQTNLRNAYKMVKQAEKIEECNKNWMANFKLLEN